MPAAKTIFPASATSAQSPLDALKFHALHSARAHDAAHAGADATTAGVPTALPMREQSAMPPKGTAR